MKPSSTSAGIAKGGLGERLDPAPDPWFTARVTAVSSSGTRPVHSLIEVWPDLRYGGYEDKPGGQETAKAYEFNDSAVDVGTIVRARLRAVEETGDSYEFFATGDGGGTGAKFVDVVHVVGVAVNSIGQRTYTVVRVDRLTVGNNLRESVPRKQYAGVFEAQNRAAVVDGSFPVTHELPLYLDVAGRYFFQVDQYAAGYALPDDGTEGGFLLPGHVSGTDQVLGDGVKGFRRGERVNVSRRSADGSTYPVETPAVVVYTDIGATSPYAWRVFPLESGGGAVNAGEPSRGVAAHGAALGTRDTGRLTGSYPLTLDGAIYASVLVHRSTASNDAAHHFGTWSEQPDGFGGTVWVGVVGGDFASSPSWALGAYTYFYTANIPTNGDPTLSTFTPPTFGIINPRYGSAYGAWEINRFCRGIEEYNTLLLSTPGGGTVTVDIAGGLWWRIRDAAGNLITGDQVIGVGAAAGGVGAAQGGGVGSPATGNPSITGGAAMAGTGGMFDMAASPVE